MAKPALLFDLDGTLIDSDPIHAEVFVELFAERGRTIDTAHYVAKFHGRLNTDIFGEQFPGEDPLALHHEKEARFRDRLPANVAPTPGAVSLLNRAEAAGWGVAVVTNAMRLNADAMLGALGLTDRLPTIIVGEECPAGKPDPWPYRAALETLGVAPDLALAFEDSPTGLASASGAGIPCVGLRSSLSDNELRAAGAHITINDFTDPALEPLLDRLEGALA